MGLHPPKTRYVKPYQYRVQPNDDVGSITGFFGMPEYKWPELVGANVQKVLGDAPAGCRHRCFRDLEVGERLSIPAHWREPVETGLGDPMVIPSGMVRSGAIDLLKAFQVAVLTSGIIPPEVLASPPPQIPAADLPGQLAAVIYSWWPHLADTTLPSVPPIPVTPGAWVKMIADGVITEENWALLFVSANNFLKATGIGQAEGPAVQTIPWADIPWASFPWEAITSLPNAKALWAQLTAIFARKDAEDGPNTTSPVLASGSQPTTPNFITTDWGAQPYSQLIGDTTWSEFWVEVAKDPRAASCVSAKPEQIAKLKGCPQCWSTPTQFVDLLCLGKDDPCDCKTSPTTPGGGSSSNTGWYVAAGIGVVAILALAVTRK